MFAEFLKRLTNPAPVALPEEEAQLALAALMVRVARSDGDYAMAEVERIDQLLVRRFRLSSKAAAALRQDAEMLEAEAPDTVRFTRAIKDTVPYEDRASVIEALWEIVLADGTRDYEEGALLRLLANLLGVTDQDSNLIRQRIENKNR